MKMLSFFLIWISLSDALLAQDDLLQAAFTGVAEIGKQWNGEVNSTPPKHCTSSSPGG